MIDGGKEEKRRVLIDFVPNILALLINTISYYYANVVGLFRCGNQKVWVKTKHKVTNINYKEAESIEEDKQQITDENADEDQILIEKDSA